MKRIHRRIFRLTDKIDAIEREALLVAAELEHHRSISDDAQRDAAVGSHIDREEAKLTAGDVRRFERALASLDQKRRRLVSKRDHLIGSLPD